MANDDGGEKTEEPTHKKLQDARKKGQVWKSKDLSGVMVFAIGLGTVKAMFPTFRAKVVSLFEFSLEKLAHPTDYLRVIDTAIFEGLVAMVFVSLPIVVAGAIAGGLADFLQVGALFSMEVIKPKFEKLNPVQGLKNMFAKKQFVEMIKNVVKVGVTAYVVYGVVRDAMDVIALTIRSDEHMLVEVMGELVFRIASRVAILFVVFAIFDVWWQHRVFHKDMMMTKDEVKREYKESEGDPHHKAHRKQMHHEIIEQAAMQNVRKADVVVTNPEHVAVALRYDRDQDGAPKVLCKGVETRAAAIRELAKEADVPIMRNVPLAHALLRLEVGDEIPEDLYDAVAEVLNFVYSLRDGAAGERPPA
ncbi:MAG TPA: type III secretion system export apparatus subunit SctU [Myxococcales bacterium]|nr:type III secretion system export apparatus subunit SctU [Myxococcales bacterium]